MGDNSKFESTGRPRSKMKVRVCCLPIAGIENPYQHLMMEGLRKSGFLDVRHGEDGKVLAALRTVLKSRPDVIHYDWISRYFLRRHRIWTWVHAPVFILEIAIVRYLFGCRVVWTMHNLSAHDQGEDRVEQWVRRCFASLCDWIRVFDQSTVERASDFLGIDESVFHVIPEGSYVGYYPNSIDKRLARERLRLGFDDFVLLYFGQIRPYKGIEDLIDAFETVRRPNWRLLMAGRPLDERYTDEIVARSAKALAVSLFMEFIADIEVQTFFNASDVVVLPFKKVENSGTAILAMGFGKPVIAPRLGALPRRLRQQEELLYEHSMLCEALAKVSAYSRKELEIIGEQNRYAVSQHAWPDFALLFASKEEITALPVSIPSDS